MKQKAKQKMKASNKLLLGAGLFFIALILSLALLTCTAKNNQHQGERLSFAIFKKKVIGDQKIIQKNYTFAVSKLSALSLDVPGDVIVQINPHPSAAAKAVITCDSNLLPYIKVYIQRDTLFLTKSADVRLAPSRKIKIIVNIDGLTSIFNQGANDVTVNNLKGGYFYAEIKGAGNSKFYGEVKNFAVTVDGVGDVDAHHLKAENVRVKIKGAGEILTHAVKSIDIDIQGAGSVGYYGDPKNISRSLHGFGVIKSLEDRTTMIK